MRFVIVDNVNSDVRGIIYRGDTSQGQGKSNVSLLGTSGTGKALNSSAQDDDEPETDGFCCKKKKKKETKPPAKQPMLAGLKDNEL